MQLLTMSVEPIPIRDGDGRYNSQSGTVIEITICRDDHHKRESLTLYGINCPFSDLNVSHHQTGLHDAIKPFFFSVIETEVNFIFYYVKCNFRFEKIQLLLSRPFYFIFHFFPVNYPYSTDNPPYYMIWDIYGIYMGYIWDIGGISMG